MDYYLQPFMTDMYGTREKYAHDEISTSQYNKRRQHILEDINTHIDIDVLEGVLTAQVSSVFMKHKFAAHLIVARGCVQD